MEDYKTMYEQALERAKNYHKGHTVDVNPQAAMEYVFPTLKENKDEDIRKALIESFKIHDLRALIIPGFSAKDVIDWLEKVGKHNEQNFWEKCKHCECFDGYDLCLHKKNFGSVTDESKENCKNNIFFIEKQVEQKLTDKVEPKFKVGDIITNKKSKDTVKIVQILHDSYCYSGWDGAATVHSDFSISEQDNWELVWGEEDEKMLNSIIEVLEVTPSARFIPIKRETMIPWLESIKERMKG